METKPARNIPATEMLEALALAFVRNGGAEISQFIGTVYPCPAFDANDSTWNARRLRWQDEVYSGNGVAYADCVSSQCTQAFIRLTKSGKIREHITGWGFSTYSAR